MTYLATIVLLGLLILIHEAGHLAAARLAGIPVASFAVGFGPRVWSRWWRGTEYSLRLLPLGGFVLPAVADDAEFRAIPLGKRLAYYLAGPLANLAAAVPLFALLNVERRGLSFYEVVVAPLGQVVTACGNVLGLLPNLLARPDEMMGVIGIAVVGGQAFQSGMVLNLAIWLTLSLAVLNLLPIPVLDGGQVLLSCLEEAFPRLVRLRVPLTVAGLVLLAAVMVYANVQDAFRYWG